MESKKPAVPTPTPTPVSATVPAAIPAAAAPAPPKLALPVSVVTPPDVGRLTLELEQIETQILQLRTRQAEGDKSSPVISQAMSKVVEHNRLNLAQSADRQKLKTFLADTKRQAPVLHISFNSEPSTAFLDKLVLWLRREIHPQVLLTIGLQPAIGAGCIVRTTNKYFDLSMRQTFIAARPRLLEQLIPDVKEAKPA